MAEIYVTPRKFAKLSKGKKVKHYPNECCKQVDGVNYFIVQPDIECKCYKMKPEEYCWFIGIKHEVFEEKAKDLWNEPNGDVYILECDWFPKDLVVGVENGRYSMRAELSRKTGWIQTQCLGSNCCAFTASGVKEAIKILNKNGYKFSM